ncbi:MAG: hypothetical protein ACOC4M_16255 [Promethearchaeia archaeon]
MPLVFKSSAGWVRLLDFQFDLFLELSERVEPSVLSSSGEDSDFNFFLLEILLHL